MEKIFFDSWTSIIRSSVITILAYIFLVVCLRVSGKRTLSKMNAFDFVITIALGSCLATVALDKKITLSDGCLVFFLLIFLQYVLTWLSVRYPRLRGVVTHSPTLLVYRGQVLQHALKKERVNIEELYMAARTKGISNLKEIDAIVMETTGSLTVISKIDLQANNGLDVVEGFSTQQAGSEDQDQ